jgi:hypothetical protein
VMVFILQYLFGRAGARAQWMYQSFTRLYLGLR